VVVSFPELLVPVLFWGWRHCGSEFGGVGKRAGGGRDCKGGGRSLVGEVGVVGEGGEGRVAAVAVVVNYPQIATTDLHLEVASILKGV